MNDVNMAWIGGRLTQNPEIRATQHGKEIAKLRIAVNKTWKDRDETQFLDVKVSGGWVDVIRDHCKGDSVLAHGEIRCEEYHNSSGERRRWVGIWARRIWTQERRRKSTQQPDEQQSAQSGQYKIPLDPVPADDIPF